MLPNITTSHKDKEDGLSPAVKTSMNEKMRLSHLTK